jgi:2-polyprenyl-6-methoxyphenol hydroxylase-like FAD-dependent oxidoreductase
MSNKGGSMTTVKTALVIGGGIAGPVAAMALRKAGIAATVYEAYPSTAEGVGGLLAVAPNGLDALQRIGVDVSSLGQPIQRMAIADGRGKRLGEFGGLPGLPPSRVMWRSDLYRALHDAAVARGVPFEHGKRLTAVEDGGSGVTAGFADGGSAQADIVVGADGIRSTVRTLIDPAAPPPQYVGFLGFGGAATVPAPNADTDIMHFVFGKRAFLGYWTQPDGVTVWFSNLPYPEALTAAQARAIAKDEWMRRLKETYAGDVPGGDLVASTAADGLFVLGAGEFLPSVPRWHRGRMVLVGDAAHAPSSTSGQGASLAIESAIQLARCLRDLPDPASAFAAYERLRRPRVEKIAAYAAKQNNQKVAGPIAKAILSVVMPIAMKTFFRPEKTFGWMHPYRIDWDEVVAA